MTDEVGLYSPRLDVAVGPFATQEIHGHAYDELNRTHAGLLECFFQAHSENIRSLGLSENDIPLELALQKNWNARCWLAIEIENRVSHKHLMGGAINAAALGRIGLAVAWNDENLNKFVRMRGYLRFLTCVGKNSFDSSNLFILSATQLEEAICNYIADDV
ncbi:hypothetical protein PWG14_04345 (plasmid) [Chromobacterium amazonense]|uniref:hypothetical protein n=1 Tax=Chromobacterium amazonense TaxID=1382803 RepID=UPI00237EE198|nr:hypothetical protein [Chromobacterium amazonense]MDE1711995.1 hypothetical protein [Chromobacterium amazonense]